MKKIIFVDDDPAILQGLERMFWDYEDEWETAYASSGEEALNVLSANDFDVIVSDIRMPGMTGVELLTKVEETYPSMVRIILSGHSEEETIIKSVQTAHQFLSKPCPTEKIIDTINNAFKIREISTSPCITNVISRIETLPSMPSLYQSILEEIKSSDASLKKIGEIISKDVAMSAKILKMVNSSFFGLSRHISNPSEAVCYLGLETIKTIVLSSKIFDEAKYTEIPIEFLEELWAHSFRTGVIAQKIAQSFRAPKEVIDTSFMGGMLHDVGRLIFYSNFADDYFKIFPLINIHKCTVYEAEIQVFGTSHAEVGAYLMGLWGLPDALVSAITYHHNPDESTDNHFNPLTAVHVADALEHKIKPFMRKSEIVSHSTHYLGLNEEYIKKLKISPHIQQWKDLALSVGGST